MDNYTSENTISDSKEESIEKAICMLQGEHSPLRPVIRPNIPTGKIIAGFFIWSLVTAGSVALLLYIFALFSIPPRVSHPAAFTLCLLIAAIKARSFIRSAVLLYQKYAPEKMRRSCLFTPSCSEYMLLAIDKYGVASGTLKGIRRLMKCHPPNGGVDYP